MRFIDRESEIQEMTRMPQKASSRISLYALACFNLLLDVWLRIRFVPSRADKWYHPQWWDDSLYHRLSEEPGWYALLLLVNLAAFFFIIKRGRIIDLPTLLIIAGSVRLTSFLARVSLGDAVDYEMPGWFFEYGREFAEGNYPAMEYPQIALLFFTLIYKLSAGRLEAFVLLFPLLQIPFELVTVSCIYKVGEREGSPFFGSVCAAFYATSPFTLTFWFCKYDSIPTAFLLLSIYLFAKDKFIASALATSAGFVSKWLPALVTPVFILNLLKSRRYRAALEYTIAFIVGLVVLLIPFWLISPEKFVYTYQFHAKRTITAESFFFIPSYFLEPSLRKTAEITPWDPIRPSPISVRTAVMLQALFIGAILIVFALLPPKRERSIAFAALAVVAFILLNRIFSPQFMLFILGAYLASFSATIRSRKALLFFISSLGFLTLANFIVWPTFASYWFFGSFVLFSLAWTLWFFILFANLKPNVLP
jgi:hypothetical protein